LPGSLLPNAVCEQAAKLVNTSAKFSRTDVGFREQTGKHLLRLSFMGFDPL
jgi:hypothetical protein